MPMTSDMGGCDFLEVTQQREELELENELPDHSFSLCFFFRHNHDFPKLLWMDGQRSFF